MSDDYQWIGSPIAGVPLNYRAKLNRLMSEYCGFGGDVYVGVNHNVAAAKRVTWSDLPPGAVLVEIVHKPACMAFKGRVGHRPLQVMFGCDCDPDVSIVSKA